MTALLKTGLHPGASAALILCGIPAAQVVQTIGSAKASAGTHAPDGTVDGHQYCAAVDISVHHPQRLTRTEIHSLVSRLADNGFAAYYRNPGEDHWPANEEEHIHAVYCGCAMKEMLRTQVHDYLHRKNGLASHADYSFFQPSPTQAQGLRALFLVQNPANG